MSIATAPAATVLPCRTDPEAFFPESGNTIVGRAQIEHAKALCRRCPIRVKCLQEWRALAPRQRDIGVVAGGEFFKVGSGEGTARFRADRADGADLAEDDRRPGTVGARTSPVREWCWAAGLPVPPSGPIARFYLDAYNAAHPEEVPL